MHFVILKFILALIFLIFSADMIVRSAVKIADYFKASKFLVGLFVIGFGTSLPELIAGIQAARLDATSIVLGNIIGSNIANIFLILGITALVYPMHCNKKFAIRDGIVLLLATLIFILIGFYLKVISFYMGLFFVILFFCYIGFVLKTHPKESIESEVEMRGEKISQKKMFFNVFFLALFLYFLGTSADVMIQEAIVIATYFNISQAMIGLTVIAIGTSLPELATCLIAAFRKHSDIAFGNIMGSNIYNIICIPGFSALINPLVFENLQTSLWILLITTCLFLYVAIFLGRFTRFVGLCFTGFYFLYIYFIISY